MDFIVAHSALVAALVVALADFVFALAPGIDSNGIVHAIYLWVKQAAGSKPAA